MTRFIVALICFCLSTALGAKIDLRGTLRCTPDAKAPCELSGATGVRVGKEPFILAPNDKDGNLYLYKAQVFEAPSETFVDRLEPTYVITPPADYFIPKVEGMATVGDWVIVMGAYFTKDPKKTGNLNLVAFKVDAQGKPSHFHRLAGPELHPVLSNTAQKFNDIDAPIPSFIKLEAVTVVPLSGSKHKLVLGVRTLGVNETSQKDVIQFLACDMTVDKEGLTLGKTWKPLMDMKQNPGYGVSDLSYGAATKMIYMTASLETAEGKLDGALWTISAKDFLKGKDTFERVKDLSLSGYKPEGVMPLAKNANRILILCDQDRTPTSLANGRAREPNESPFFVIDSKGK